MFGTFWSLLPLIIAILLALLTKEVYGSLLIGIICGGLLATSFSPLAAFDTIFNDGIFAVLSDTRNVGIFLFIIFLGMLVELMKKSGATKAYCDWALNRIRSKRGALASTFILSLLLSVDDYLHCLTVGSVMLPVNDYCGVSRARFAYQIDATAAPLCIMLPVSSWATTISTVTERSDSMILFIKTIPYNFYSILTLFMILFLIIIGFEFGPMKKSEEEALRNPVAYEAPEFIKSCTLDSTDNRSLKNGCNNIARSCPHILDLILPILFLLISSVAFFLYTGNFFRGCDFISAFNNCNASYSLAASSMITFILTLIYYMLRGLIEYGKALSCITTGFSAMTPALIVLALALTLKNMAAIIGSDTFISEFFSAYAADFGFLLPVVIFIFSAVFSFATGTSWGTFCILIPIVTNLASVVDERMLVIIISACLAGSVCGDHCSPISDTTIMASTGAKCDLIKHVSTQIPYVIPVAIVSCIAYAFAGVCKNLLSLVLAFILMFAVLLLIRRFIRTKSSN